MERKEIKNLNEFINIGSRYLIYSDFDCDVINKIDLGECILSSIIYSNLHCKWYGYFTLGLFDDSHLLLCYITFFDDYIALDLNVDILNYDFNSLKFIYSLFDNYYYFYE